MSVLSCHVDRETDERLERAARELGRSKADLAESAIAEAALDYERSRRQPGDPQGALALGRYPEAPGFKDQDTSKAAAQSVATRAELLRGRCLGRLRSAGPDGLTSDEAAAQMGETVLSIRPRFTELLQLGKIVDSGLRRRNASGRKAKVWRVA